MVKCTNRALKWPNASSNLAKLLITCHCTIKNVLMHVHHQTLQCKHKYFKVQHLHQRQGPAIVAVCLRWAWSYWTSDICQTRKHENIAFLVKLYSIGLEKIDKRNFNETDALTPEPLNRMWVCSCSSEVDAPIQEEWRSCPELSTLKNLRRHNVKYYKWCGNWN